MKITKFDEKTMDSIIFDEKSNCAYLVEDVKIFDFNGEEVSFETEVEIEISTENELVIDVDFSDENNVFFCKKFHCAEHAIEFCKRNLSGEVKVSYLLFCLKWDKGGFCQL
jgi:hypothetical protein